MLQRSTRSALIAVSLFSLLVVAHESAASSAQGPWSPSGLAGCGGMFAQAISPVDNNLMMVTCDMGASYVTRDGGASWEVLNWRQLGFMGGASACPPVFHPTDVNTIYAYGQQNNGGNVLLISHDKGHTWTQQSNPWGGAQICALYQDRGNPSLMFAGVNNTAYWSGDEGKTWTAASGLSGSVLTFFIDWRSSVSSRTCYAGTSSGIFRSTDSGKTWAAFNSGLSTTSLRSFAGGANSSTLALFCIDTNWQVWKSTNGGAWSNITGSTLGSQQPWQIALSETNPSILYVTNNAGNFETTTTMMYKSTDGGATWSPNVYQYHASGGNVEWTWEAFDRPAARWDDGTLIRNMQVSATDPNSVIVGDWSRCLRTKDGGASWQQMTCNFVDSAPEATGKRWTTRGLNVTNCWFYTINPQNPNYHYIGYSDICMARSEDGGNTWYYGASGIPWSNTCYQLAFDADINGTMYAACSNQHDISMWGGDAGPTLPGGICKSTDYGRTWVAASSGLPTNLNFPTCSVVVDPTDHTLYCATYGDGVYHSTDKAASWTKCASSGLFNGTNNNHNVYRLLIHKDGTLFLMVEGKLVQNSSGWDFPDPGALFKSTDKGNSWTNITTNVAGGLPLYNPQDFDVDPNNSSTIYIAASNGKYPHLQSGCYKTTNGGASWTNPALPWGASFTNSVMIDKTTPSTIYFGSTNGFFVSYDSGSTFQEACVGLPYVSIRGISVDHTSNTIFLATTGAGGFKGTLLPLTISNVASSGITTSGATITWSTNAPANSQVDYGTTTAYGSSSALNSTLVSSHSVALSGLAASTTYHFRVKSTDGSGAAAVSGDFTFTTSAGSVQPPTITTQPANQTVNAGQSATFTVAASGTGLSYQWQKNGANILGATAASYTTPATTSADNNATFRAVVSNSGGSVTSNSATLTVISPTESPYGGTPWPIPGTIEAENYDLGGERLAYHDADAGNNGGAYRTDGVDVRACVDTNGGYQVGWTVTGEWLKYTVNVAATGSYALAARVASGGSGGTIHFEFDGTNVSGPINIPNTGSYDTWQSVTQTVQLTAGQHIMRVAIDSSGGFDLNWFSFTAIESPYGGTPWPIPGTIQAEDFDNGGEGIAYHDSDVGNTGGSYRNTDVDIRACVDTGGGYQVGWTAAGEWLKYTANVAATGSYVFTARIANGSGSAGAIHLEVDGTNVSGSLSVPATGGWDTWQSISTTISLTAGQHVLRLYIETAGFDINYLNFAQAVNHPPVITSAATATPATAQTGQAISFTVAASDPDNDSLTYSWNFGDGATASGATASHSYTAAGTYTAVATVTDGRGGSVSSGISVTITAAPPATAIRIDSGGAASGTFAADGSFSGGYTYKSTTAINTTGVTNPAPQAVYQSERYGNFTYTIGGLSAGTSYTVRLHFAEIYWSSAGQRVFNVAINGTQVIANFDIYAAAGGNFKAIVKEFTAAADGSGNITIVYTTLKDNAKSSGIEVLSQTSGTILNKYGAAVARDDALADPSLVLTSIDLGSVQVGKPFKVKLELPESGKAAAKLHWKAVKANQLPAGVRASGAYIGGKAKTAGTYTFQLEFLSADKKMITNTYTLTVTP